MAVLDPCVVGFARPRTRRTEMAYGIVHHFKGGTKEQYENALKAVHPDGGKSLPPGQTFHAAGPSDDGWVIVAIHDSRESWERFRDDTLLPTLPTVENGFAGPPHEQAFEVQHNQTA
jgi:hypothetical protein